MIDTGLEIYQGFAKGLDLTDLAPDKEYKCAFVNHPTKSVFEVDVVKDEDDKTLGTATWPAETTQVMPVGNYELQIYDSENKDECGGTEEIFVVKKSALTENL